MTKWQHTFGYDVSWFVCDVRVWFLWFLWFQCFGVPRDYYGSPSYDVNVASRTISSFIMSNFDKILLTKDDEIWYVW